jgi:predicted Zn-dependent peptidase
VEREQLDERLVRVVAPSGLRVLTEVLPGVRSAAVGIWVRSGSAHERPEQMGISHLLEHMVFKGTERRTARELALELEGRGGTLDACTARDHTWFQAHVLDADLPVAVEVLTDLVRRPLLRPSDLELERQVVLEEIAGVADAPDDLVFELHARALWPTHGYGYSILGTPETVSEITADDLRAAHAAGYYPGNCIIAAAGSVGVDQLLAVLEREGWLEEEPAIPPRPPVDTPVAERGREVQLERETHQCHLVIGTDTLAASDPRRYALALLTAVLGGGMSSRLFQRVREELGLAYAIFAYQHLYRVAGQIGVYCATQPETSAQALDAIVSEYAALAREGLRPDELTAGRQQLKGQVMLGLESPMSRMHRLANLELIGEPYRPLDDLLGQIDAVGAEEVAALAAEFLDPARQTVARLGAAVHAPQAAAFGRARSP